MKSKYLSFGLFTLSLTLLDHTGQAADCNGQIISGDPSKDTIATAYLNALNGGNICSGNFPPTNDLSNTFNLNDIFFNVTRTSNSVSLTNCQPAFQNIISQCVRGENQWGGTWQLGGEFYGIYNNIYPSNGLGTSTTPPPNTVTAPPQTSFTTEYIPGVTANTVTTTQLSGQSSPTLLPIWYVTKISVDSMS
jgi:hypothetical protein